MSNSANKLIPPLTFRLYQTVKFNRPVDSEKDIVSAGGYALTMKDEDGNEKTISFDFEDSEVHGASDDCIKYIIQKNPDYSSFPDLNTVTEYMLHNITDVIEWYIYTGEDDNEDPLFPVKISNVMITIINDSTGKDIPIIQIPVNIPITLYSQSTSVKKTNLQ